jgi:hypothetical protein
MGIFGKFFGKKKKSLGEIESKKDKKIAKDEKRLSLSFTEKDNLGTNYDTTSRGTAYWRSRMLQGPDYPFVIYYFDNEKNASEALLELPCIHIAEDSKKLICTEILDFGYYQKESGEYAAFICGKDLTYELWEQAKTNFAKHGGIHINEQEPEKRATLISKATKAQPGKVVFVREESKQGMMGETAVHRIYKGPDAASAQAFLKQNPVTKNFYYIVVETPDGKYCRDIQGFYKI